MDKCPKCGEILTLTEQSSKIAELEKDGARLDWIADNLKLTLAHALKWPYTPQDPVSFRAKIDLASSGQGK